MRVPGTQNAINTNVASAFGRNGKQSITANNTYRSMIGDIDEENLSLLRAPKEYRRVTIRQLLDLLVGDRLRLVNDPILESTTSDGLVREGMVQRNPIAQPWWANQVILMVRFTPEGRTADIGQLTANVRECPLLRREMEATGNYRKGKADIWEIIDGVQRLSMILGAAMGRIPVVGGDDPPDEGEDGDGTYDPQLMVYMIEDDQGKGWKRLMAAAYQYCKKNYGRAPEQLPRFLRMIEQWQIETIGHIENQWSPDDDSDSEADAGEQGDEGEEQAAVDAGDGHANLTIEDLADEDDEPIVDKRHEPKGGKRKRPLTLDDVDSSDDDEPDEKPSGPAKKKKGKRPLTLEDVDSSDGEPDEKPSGPIKKGKSKIKDEEAELQLAIVSAAAGNSGGGGGFLGDDEDDLPFGSMYITKRESYAKYLDTPLDLKMCMGWSRGQILTYMSKLNDTQHAFSAGENLWCMLSGIGAVGRIGNIQDPFKYMVTQAGLASDRHVWFLHICRLITTCMYDSVLKEPSRGSGKWVEELFARINNKNAVIDDHEQEVALEKALWAMAHGAKRTTIDIRDKCSYDDLICATRVLYGHFMESSASAKTKSELKRLGNLAIDVIIQINTGALPETCKQTLKSIAKKASIGPRVDAFRTILCEVGKTTLQSHSPSKVKAYRPKKFDDTRYYEFGEEGEIAESAACFRSQAMPSAASCMKADLDDVDDL